MFANEITTDNALLAIMDAQQTSTAYFEQIRQKYPLMHDNNGWTYNKCIIVAENNDL